MRTVLGLVMLVGACGFNGPDLVGDDGVLPDANPDGVIGGEATIDGDNEIDSSMPPAWLYRRKLSIDNTGQGDLTRFGLVVLLDPSRIDYSKLKTDGSDLRFGDAIGTFYPHEIERWDPAGKSVVWVRVETIAAEAITDLYLYYGNANATDAQAPTEVWNGEYAGVWHLADAHDSTSQSVSVNVGTTTIEGSFGPARDFSGVGQYIDTGNTEQLGATYTVEAWMRPEGGPTTPSFSAPVGRFPNYLILWNCASSAFCRTALHNISTGGGNEQTFAADYDPATSNQWSYVVARWNGSALRTFVNGVAQPSVPTTGSPILTNITAKIGARGDIAGFFNGQIEEVRISRNARGDDYIRAHYRAETNQYITVWGDEEPNPNP